MTRTAPRCLLCRNSGYDDLDTYDGRIGLCRTHAAETTARGQRWCNVCQRRYAGSRCAHALAAKSVNERVRRQTPAVRAVDVARSRAWRAANLDAARAACRRRYARNKADPSRWAALLARNRRANAVWRQKRDRGDRRAEYQRMKLRQWRRLMGTR